MSTANTQNSVQILIASGDRALAELFVSRLKDRFSVSAIGSREQALQTINSSQPQLTLLDPTLFPGDLAEKITAISDKVPGLRIMVIENQTDRAIDQYVLFKAGAHGFCHDDISGALLNRAVQLVCDGEFWVQRKLIARVISELSREAGAALQVKT